ncbi:energy-coupling factor transporter transmembrane component T [Corynebacterium breve]|uniref:Energy-coupling factor transporter transmembrane component T n=1 Tax=Corynebacterium breve TaxID=3049799 RepID=A0ABY8VGC5_9CORY|nr:energy-coupling factor transporter transmembrane component T [Corynebacterium breve]WIM68548.1 energy-coupling factor transporter transmembrane component T [Corynebacterium breve]
MNLLKDINPVTRLLGVMIFTSPLLFTLDWVSATVALVLIVVAAPLCGVGYGRLLKRGWPIFLAAPLAGIPMALYGKPGGETHFEFLLAHVTDNSLSLAGAISLRVLAVGLPVVLLSVDVDPTDLGDGLAQVLRLPAKFVLGTVAALRMLTLLRDDVEAMRSSRRSRGLADTNRVRYWFSLAFGLLVMSLRRASKLATAMEARGFARSGHRTWARESRLVGRDFIVLAVCALGAAVALGVAIYTGHFAFLGAL